MGKNEKQLDLELLSPDYVPQTGTTWTQPPVSQMCATIPARNPTGYGPTT